MVRTELSGDPRIYRVELLTVMSGAQDIGEIIKKKKMGGMERGWSCKNG